MKRSITLVLLSLAILFVTANATAAQATNLGGSARPTQEQSLQELVNEVRQLRAMLQRVNVTVYRTNVALERLKFQQEQVAHLSRELDDAREKLADVRLQISKMREVVGQVESRVAAGTDNPDDLTALKKELESTMQRELRFAQRETQLMNDLSIERSKLMELNDRLTKLELEFK